MEFITNEKGLTIKITKVEQEDLEEIYHAESDFFLCDACMYEFFALYLADTEFEWVDAEDIGALTSAPILGSRDHNDIVVEAFGFMDYAILSPLQDLMETGEAFWQRG